jgi:hypothetical protein
VAANRSLAESATATAALGHDGNRWIAASAMRLGVPLASHDGLFVGAPGLALIAVVGDK